MSHHSLRNYLVSCALVAALGGAGCDEESLFGGGEPPADVAVSTPAGIQSGDVTVIYTLSGDDGETTGITVSYSDDGGIVYRPATEGPGGDGRSNLAMSSGGELHTFVWDSQSNLPGRRESSVRIRITPEAGTSGISGSIVVQNAQYLAAAEDEQIGRVRLSRVDVNDGTMTSLGSELTGGDNPYDVIFEEGYFLVAHRSSNDVAVLELDDQIEELVPVSGSPFNCDGIGSRHLVTNGSQVFVSNTDSESITIFDFDTATGALDLHTESNVPASGCQGMAIRSAWLFVANRTADEILIFDIANDGELFQNSASPVSSGGLSGPHLFARVGSYLYVANANASTLSAFSISGTGALIAVAGSPFTISGGAGRLVANGTDLFTVSGSAAGVLSFDTDVFGAVTEDATSPRTLGGPGYAVASVAKVVVAATTTSEEYKVYTISGSGLTESSGSPRDAQAPVLRVAFSDE